MVCPHLGWFLAFVQAPAFWKSRGSRPCRSIEFPGALRRSSVETTREEEKIQMSTRYSVHALNSVGGRSTDANRVSPSGRTEQISARNQPQRKIIPHADSASHSLFGTPDPTVRRPINDRPVQAPDGVRCARRLKADLTALTARDFMRICEATLRPEDSIERAARLTCETESGAVPV